MRAAADVEAMVAGPEMQIAKNCTTLCRSLKIDA